MLRLLTRALAIALVAVGLSAAPAVATTTPLASAPSTTPGGPASTTPPTSTPKPSPAPAIGGLSARPVTADGTPTGDPFFDARQEPGSAFTAYVLVTNATDRAIPVHIGAVDATTSDNGGTVFLASKAPRRGVGTWISPGRQALTLGAGSRTRLRFRVHVPGTARPGDHVGGIVIEPDRKLQINADIKRVVRLGLAVRVRVPGEARLALDVGGLRFSRDGADARPTITVQLENGGDRLCRPYLTATFSTAAGTVTSERRHVDTLLPKTTVDYALRWARPVPDGTYDVRVRTESCGAPSAVSENVVLDTEGNVAVAAPTPTVNGRGAGIPRWAQLAALAALVLFAAAAGWRLAGRRPARRRRRRAR